jgi:hypothetical protein
MKNDKVRVSFFSTTAEFKIVSNGVRSTIPRRGEKIMLKMKKALIGTVLLLAMALGSTTAHAQTTINLGGSSSTGSIDFFAAGGGHVGMCASTSCTITNSNAIVSSITNGSTSYNLTYTLNSTGGLLALSGGGPNFSVLSGGFTTLMIADTSGGGGSSTMNFTLNLVKDSTFVPDFDGLYSVSATSGNLTPLLSGANSTGLFDFSLDLTGCTLDSISAGTCTEGTATFGKMSVGETIVPAPTPEPGSLLLFGTGLLFLGVILRRLAWVVPLSETQS